MADNHQRSPFSVVNSQPPACELSLGEVADSPCEADHGLTRQTDVPQDRRLLPNRDAPGMVVVVKTVAVSDEASQPGVATAVRRIVVATSNLGLKKRARTEARGERSVRAVLECDFRLLSSAS